MKKATKTVVMKVKQVARKVVNTVKRAVSTVYNVAKKVVNTVWGGVKQAASYVYNGARNTYTAARNYVSGRTIYGPPYYGSSGSGNYLNISGAPRSYSNMTYAQQVAAQTAYRQQQLTVQYQKATGSKGKPKTKEGQNLLKNWGTALKNTLTKFCKTAPKVAKKALQTGVSFGVGVVIQFSENTGIKPVLDKTFGEWSPKDWIAQNPGYSKGRQFGNIFGLAQAAAEYASAATIFTGGNGLSLAGAPATGGASLALSPGATALSGAIVQHATGVLASSIQNMMGGGNYGSSSGIKNVYNGIKDAPTYPKGFKGKQNGTKTNKVTNKELLEDLRKVEAGEWKKVYKDGYDNAGNKISIHYFQSKSGKVFNVKVKSNWSNK